MTSSNSNFDSCLKKIIQKIEGEDIPKKKKKRPSSSGVGGEKGVRKKGRSSLDNGRASMGGLVGGEEEIDVEQIQDDKEEINRIAALVVESASSRDNISFLFDDDACTRQIYKSGNLLKIKQNLVSWKGYPEVTQWVEVKEEDGVVDLQPSVTFRPLSLQICECSSDNLVDIIAQDKKGIRLFVLDWGDRDLDKRELKSVIQALGKANEEKLWNLLLVHNSANFGVVHQLLVPHEMPNIVDPTPIFIKLHDNPSQGSVTHTEQYRSDGNWAYVGHFDFRAGTESGKAKKSLREHYPVCELPKKLLELVPNDFASMCLETFAPNTKLVKQHEESNEESGVLRSFGFTSHIVSFLLYFCYIFSFL